MAAEPFMENLEMPGKQRKTVAAELAAGGFDVRAYGAVGDGASNDTGAIQRAIDACGQAGGGVVLLQRGSFLSGGLHLRSHVELHLSSTAVLLALPDLAQYMRDEKMPYRLINRALIYAEGCTDVAITGQGTIDGQGGLLRRDLEAVHGKAWWGKAENTERVALVRLRGCRNVRLEGVLLKDSQVFAVHPIQCEHLRIDGLRIHSRVLPNTDGIDVDGCRDVFISNCHIVAGDDCIALKTIEAGAACHDIVVTNCVMSTLCAAIRVGPDAVADIYRVAVSNCVIYDTNLTGVKIEESFGAAMRDMVFSNLVMDNVGGPISIRLAGWKGPENVWSVFDDSNWKAGTLEHIQFDNIRARVMADGIKSCIQVTGTACTRPRHISFSNMDISFPGGGTAEEAARRDVPDIEHSYPEIGMFGILPAYGLYAHHADGLVLNNVRFETRGEELRPAMDCFDVTDLELAGFRASGHARAEAVVRLRATRRVLVHGSRPLDASPTFLRVEGAGSGDIHLRGNALPEAAREVECAAGADSAGVHGG
jgi:hypothetical protein